jgi:hypothetical protein
MPISVEQQQKLLEDFGNNNPGLAMVIVIADEDGKFTVGTSNFEPSRLTEFFIDVLYFSQHGNKKEIHVEEN